MLSKSYRSLQSYIYIIIKLQLRTSRLHQNCLYLFVLFISVIRTGTWQINDVTQFDVSCSSNMSQIAYILTYLLTYSIQQSLSWDSNRNSASEESPRILRTRRFITAIKVSASVSILSQLDPVHTPTSHFLKIHFNIILINTSVSQVVSFLQVSPPKPCIHLPSPHTVFNVLP